MIRAVIFDADGVIINKPALFSECLSRDYNIPLEKITPFFENEFQPCVVGQADLKEQIKPYLPVWGWKGSVEDILAYWFKVEDYKDQRLIQSIEGLKKKNTPCYLATVQEKYRGAYLATSMGFSSLFDKMFYSCDVGYKKERQGFWQIVYNTIGSGIAKSEIVVWDDEQQAIDAATQFGFIGRLYTGFDFYRKEMEKLIP